MKDQIKDMYDLLKSSEALPPDMSGDWLSDKEKFIKEYQKNNNFIDFGEDTLLDGDSFEFFFDDQF